MKLNKNLYGCLNSALLFYQHISSELRKKGFTINPYDLYVANQMVNGKKMMVTSHVDDLKISHMIKWL